MVGDFSREKDSDSPSPEQPQVEEENSVSVSRSANISFTRADPPRLLASDHAKFPSGRKMSEGPPKYYGHHQSSYYEQETPTRQEDGVSTTLRNAVGFLVKKASDAINQALEPERTESAMKRSLSSNVTLSRRNENLAYQTQMQPVYPVSNI